MRLAVAGDTGLIGSQVRELAGAAGHEVVRLSRSAGTDLTDPGSVGDRLQGVEAVVDVTRPTSMAREEAREFFTTVATTLGAAARAAGVPRTVVLSIVGIDEGQDFDWYVATLAHEQATRAHAPGPVVLRATQFHEFPGQVLDRATHQGRAEVMDVPTQPVESAEVARTLVELATTEEATDVDLAGPRVERLVDLARQVARWRDDGTEVTPGSAPASMAGGSMLPGPDALVRGVDWGTWLASQPRGG